MTTVMIVQKVSEASVGVFILHGHENTWSVRAQVLYLQLRPIRVVFLNPLLRLVLALDVGDHM